MTAADYPFEDSLMSLVYLRGAGGALLPPRSWRHQRKVTNLGSIAVINVFLGWTLVGWVVALAMAVRSLPPGISTWLDPPERELARTAPA